jgi:hypothetical protein
MLTGTMKLSYEPVSKPRSWVRAPKTPLRPRKKIVGARTPGIAAPGTRISSFFARAIRAAIVARSARQEDAVAASISRPATGA